MTGTILKAEVERKLIDLSSSQLAMLGFRVVDVDVRQAARSLVRFFIERMANDAAPVSLEDCAGVSRTIGSWLEREDWFNGSYDLEVSSPGLDRRLRTQSDFESVVGEELRIKLNETIPGLGANARGYLIACEGSAIHLRVSGKDFTVPLQKIVKAQTVWNFRQNPHR